MLSKFTNLVKERKSEIILAIGVALISLFSFLMGYITAKYQEKEPLIIETTGEEISEINTGL
ncbi:MAG: hypothetical protein A3F15_02320 [Candidatus Wildermuthbacteria bacterium RIFCSPHIGHO2_12_FULL_40_12]|uniref:Polysaccharide chain length determinant N-terminal domain-containing protein n=1 Tax=Candidatus Wildermuthbacteria bacterium RIFCSPHIGHO2_12_FULL_40_12 TaxID=1802457 RepID=A0A1G2RCY2_9BACT|nr:MAG: hypothetical protein A3F15_02320 [Candidatus Wildermuthbacteria bacterium RIFCSPHIGHO2_12_FULL_40_12]